MATVYSLVCWGGKDGKTVTMTIASPCVVSLTNHGLRDGTGVVFSTTGALPTGVTVGTTYYSRSTASGTFNLYDTAAHAIAGGSTGIVNTSGSQSGTHLAKGAYYLGLSDKSRWTTGGTERTYEGIAAWISARSTAGVSAYDEEVCEIGEAFTEITSTQLVLNLAAATTLITSTVNGVRTGAFHDGDIPFTGYVYKHSSAFQNCFNFSAPRTRIDGITIQYQGTGENCLIFSKMFCVFSNNILAGWQLHGDGTTGMQVQAPACEIYNNLVYNFSTGVNITGYGNCRGLTMYNNLVALCYYGFRSGDAPSAEVTFLNNIAVGNTTNWDNSYIPSFISCGSNAGESGNSPWYAGTDTSIVMATSDFSDYSNYNFRPASASSPQVNIGQDIYDGYYFDITDAVRPNYEAATYPNNVLDVGPYEFDHGEGLAPSPVSISITGMASGSEIAIYKASDMSVILAPQSTSGSYSGTYTYTGDTNIIVRVRKGTSVTRYLPYEYAGTITSTGFQLVVSQIPDTIAQ